MYRNLRVRRELLKWRQEGNSYCSLIPLDLINLTVGYVSPDIWKELIQVKQLWENSLVTPEGQCQIPRGFLPDHSLIIASRHETARRISLTGEIQPVPNLIGYPLVSQQGEIWVSSEGIFPEYIFGRYDLEKQMITEKRSYLTDGSCYNFFYVRIEDGTSYLMVDTSSGLQIVKYYSDGSVGPAYRNIPFIHQLNYDDGYLYLINSRVRYRLPLLEDEDRIFDPAVYPKVSIKIRENLIEFQGKDDVFALTGRSLFLIAGEEKLPLFKLPSDGLGYIFCLLPTGEYLVLVQTPDCKFYRLYCLS